MKLANQGYLTGNHAKTCPFEELGKTCEQCILFVTMMTTPNEKQNAYCQKWWAISLIRWTVYAAHFQCVITLKDTGSNAHSVG
jgi:hypothetical protein